MRDVQTRPEIYDAARVRKILRAFGLEGDRDPDVLPMPQGFGLALARVLSAGHDLVLKQLPAERPRPRTLFALAYHAHLHDAGIPSPRLHRTLAGEPFVDVDGLLFCVQDWCSGERFDPDAADTATRREHRRQLGALLGRIHAAATPQLAAAAPDSCRPPAARLFTGLPAVARGLPWTRGGPLARLAWLRLHERGSFGRELRRVLPVLEATRRRLVATPLADDPRLAAALPVHGDVHFENVLFAGGRVAGLLDFDNAAVSSRAFDIGSTLAVVCQEREHEEEFLAAFEAAGGGPRPDPEVLRACVLLRLANSLSFQIVAYTRRQVRSPEKARWWLRRLIRLLASELEAGQVAP